MSKIQNQKKYWNITSCATSKHQKRKKLNSCWNVTRADSVKQQNKVNLKNVNWKKKLETFFEIDIWCAENIKLDKSLHLWRWQFGVSRDKFFLLYNRPPSLLPVLRSFHCFPLLRLNVYPVRCCFAGKCHLVHETYPPSDFTDAHIRQILKSLMLRSSTLVLVATTRACSNYVENIQHFYSSQ